MSNFKQKEEYVQPTKFEYLEMKLGEASNWFINNVPTYWANEEAYNQGLINDPRGYYKTPHFTRLFGDDCTEFVTYYMSTVANKEFRKSYTLEMIDKDNCLWDDEVKEAGWNYYTTDHIAKNGGLQYGDVLICDDRYGTSQFGQHAEIYLDKAHTFGWGSVKKVFPTDNAVIETNVNGEIHYQDKMTEKGHDYIAVYRYEGEVPEDILIKKQVE